MYFKKPQQHDGGQKQRGRQGQLDPGGLEKVEELLLFIQKVWLRKTRLDGV